MFARSNRWVGTRGAALKEMVGDEPFAVVLSDDIIDAECRCCGR